MYAEADKHFEKYPERFVERQSYLIRELEFHLGNIPKIFTKADDDYLIVKTEDDEVKSKIYKEREKNIAIIDLIDKQRSNPNEVKELIFNSVPSKEPRPKLQQSLLDQIRIMVEREEPILETIVEEPNPQTLKKKRHRYNTSDDKEDEEFDENDDEFYEEEEIYLIKKREQIKNPKTSRKNEKGLGKRNGQKSNSNNLN
jgi:type IV secretory pathway VirB10-like protein